MESLVQRKDPVRLFWRRVLLLALLILVIIGMSSVWRIYMRERESAALNQESAAHLADLTKREAELKSNIANLSTNRGKEAALREQYRMGKSGEKLIIIINPLHPSSLTATSTSLMRWFKDWFVWW